jgi:hypothetical protein
VPRLSRVLLVASIFAAGIAVGQIRSGPRPSAASDASGAPNAVGTVAYVSIPDPGAPDGRKRHLLTVENVGRKGGAWKLPVRAGDDYLDPHQWLIEVEGTRYILVGRPSPAP